MELLWLWGNREYFDQGPFQSGDLEQLRRSHRVLDYHPLSAGPQQGQLGWHCDWVM